MTSKSFLLLLFLLVVFLAACSNPTAPPAEAPTSTAKILPTATLVTVPTATPSPQPTKTPTQATPTLYAVAIHVPELAPAKAPAIHDAPGAVYETLFSIPVGEGQDIQYEIPSCCGGDVGPNALAVLPHNTFLILDAIGKQLVYYDRDGRLLKKIQLDALGKGWFMDLRVRGDEIFLLETAYQNFRVHRLTLDGELITSEEIPYQYLVDPEDKLSTLESMLSGIAIDCERRIILEVTGGAQLFPLAEVQQRTDPSLITQGFLCNDQRFFVSTPGLWMDPQVTAGERIYQTQLTEGLGGLHFLDVFEDGSFYLVRNDVMPVNPVDQTIHYIDGNGDIQGMARVPLSEFFYHSATRETAVGPDGEVYVLLPRQDSLDIVHLKFYRELETLMPEAVIPQITVNRGKP